ncbi:MAG: hypothetical protein AAGF28_01200 [Pseudomonadota bacterium]
MQTSYSPWSALRALAIVLFLLVNNQAVAANNEIVGAALGQLFKSGTVETGSSTANSSVEALTAFYASRSFKPVWSRDAGPKGKARALVSELKRSPVHGLSPKFYNITEIERLMASTRPEDLARLDMLLTGALVDFAHNLLNGRISGEQYAEINAVPPIRIPAAALVDGAADAGNLRDYITKLIGEDRRYIRLISKLAEFVRTEKSGLWPEAKFQDTVTKRNGKHKSIPDLRKVLALSGDLPLDQMNDSEVLDDKLAASIRIFQERHGLQPTGLVDKALLAEINVPLAARIAQLQLNLERRRWENKEPAERHVYVNIADESIKLTRSDKTVGLLSLKNTNTLKGVASQYSVVTEVTIDANSVLSLRFVDQSKENAARDLVILEQLETAKRNLSALLTANDMAKIDAARAGSSVTLETPVELYISYLTAWAVRDGSIQIRADKFGYDAEIAGALKLSGE